MIVYFNGGFMPKEEVCISPDDRGFLFADGVYEVILASEGGLFAAEAHFARLARSLRALAIPSPELPTLRQAVVELLRRNDLDDAKAKVYIQITRGVAPRGHAFPEEPVPPTVYATVRPYDPPKAKWEKGVEAILVPDLRWARCDIKSLALLPNILASQQAQEAGVYDAIMVREGVITEGSHTSVGAVFENTLVTHPLTHHILGGVTRQVVLELCKELDIPFVESPIDQADIFKAEEVMLLGTTTGVMPTIAIDDHQIADGEPGPITCTLQQALLTLIERTGSQENP